MQNSINIMRKSCYQVANMFILNTKVKNVHRQLSVFPVSYSIIKHFYHWGLTFAALTVAFRGEFNVAL